MLVLITQDLTTDYSPIPIAKTLHRLYTNCIALLKKREEKFAILSKRFPSEIIAKWEAMDITPKVVGDRVISVYEANIGKDGMFFFLAMIS